ncbi:MAG TPA: AI-2E family transporter YdiK [Gammaproteobacteria bacterium]|nr:AI-2E family transporter YdiK [Gammaproteobacteria bacterium]
MQSPNPSDLTRNILSVLITIVLIVGSLWTMLPFLSGLLWATTIVVATWPLLLKVEHGVGGRRSAAAAVMTLVMFAVFVVPFGLAALTLLRAGVEGVEIVKAATSQGLPAPPSWLAAIPLIGARAAARWQDLAAGGPDAVLDALRPFLLSTANWVVSVTGGFGFVALHFVITAILAGVLYSNGETAARGVIRFARRIGQDRGERTVRLAGQALRGVALGVVVTALAQSVIAGAGLWLAGVPRVGLLVAVTFLVCVAQLGPLIVLAPVVIWQFYAGNAGWAIFLIGVTVVAVIIDNVVKPMLIRRGVDLPLLLIVAGVVGGMIGFGIAGLFVGPVVLAVTYTLLDAWIRDDPLLAADVPSPVPGAAPAAPLADPDRPLAAR